MRTPFYISPRVIETINALPMEDRVAVASAIAGEMLLGAKITDELTPMQSLVFATVRSYVKNDTQKLEMQG